jgi:hypothetical protein
MLVMGRLQTRPSSPDLIKPGDDDPLWSNAARRTPSRHHPPPGLAFGEPDDKARADTQAGHLLAAS